MKKLALLILIGLFGTCYAESVKLEITWSINPNTSTYENAQTRIQFPKTAGGFERFRESPTKEDGSASFAYRNELGVVTVYLKHKLIAQYTEHGSIYQDFFDTYLVALKESHGNPNKTSQFPVLYRHLGNTYNGTSYEAYFPDSPTAKNGAFSSLVVVQVGDFLFFFRGTFDKKKGIKAFYQLLNDFGIERITTGD